MLLNFVLKIKNLIGFYLETTKVRNIQAFTTLFTLTCIAGVWLTIIGADYSKNQRHHKNYYQFRYSKKNGKNFKRTMSLFNAGLTFFNLAFESTHYVILRCDFVLYDV